MRRRTQHRWGRHVGVLAALVTAMALGHATESRFRADDGAGAAMAGLGLPGLDPDPDLVAADDEETWPRLEPECPPPPARESRYSVDELNEYMSSLDLRYAQAGDIGASARLGDRRILFVFGDTLREPDVTPNIIANSMIVMSGSCASQVLTKGYGPIIPDREDGVVHWPSSLAVLPGEDSDRVVVITSRIKRQGGDPLAFTYLGSSATYFTVPHGGAPQREETIDLTPDDEDPGQINWGGAAMVRGEHLYLYGTQSTEGTGRTLYVARAPVESSRERSSWTFWDGSTWQGDHDAAARILPPDDPGVSQALSAHEIDGRIVLVSKSGGDLGGRVHAWTSDSPTGPWTRRPGPDAIYKDASGGLMYAPLAHPDVPIESGNLLVSVSRNPEDLGDLVANPRLGRLWFTEISPFVEVGA